MVSFTKKINTGGATFIGNSAFESCSNMVWAELPEVLVMGEDNNVATNVFLKCNKLVSVSMPNLYLIQGLYTFSYCNSLREIYMGSSNSELAFNDYTFADCDKAKIKIFVPVDMVDTFAGRNEKVKTLELIGREYNKLSR